MKIRQHRCPYFILKIKKEEIEEYLSKKKVDDNALQNYQQQLNICSQKVKEYQSVLQQIYNLVKPLVNSTEPKPLLECVEEAFISPLTKTNTLSLVKQYIQFCNNKMNDIIISNNGNNNPDSIPSIYEPDNAYNFVTTKNPPYNRTTKKKHLNTLLRLIRISTKNPFLSYSLPIGHGDSTKLKHLLTINEIKNFIVFLNETRHFIAILMVILLYKFGVRIGSLAKMKCSDLSENNQIIFREKNNAIIRRSLLDETSSLIHRLIFECNLKENDYLFYNYKFNDNEYKRSLFFSQKIRNLMISSKAFSDPTIETVSAHSFRVTHAVEVFQGRTIEGAQKELNHKNKATTFYSYVKPDVRNLFMKEEKDSLLLNKGNVIEKKKEDIFNEKKKKNQINEQIELEEKLDVFSYDLQEEGENIIDDDFMMKEKIFYFEGHFYDDVDFKEHFALNNKKQNKRSFEYMELDNISDRTKDNIIEKSKKQTIKNNNIRFLFNSNKKETIKNNYLKNYELISTLEDLKKSSEIECENNEIISSKKIKKIKDCLILSPEEEIILAKTTKLNKNGIYNNLEVKLLNNHIYIRAKEDINNNTLITTVGGKIYFYKQYLKDEVPKHDMMSPIIHYFETANKLYDRIISINPFSIIKYLFYIENENESNLKIIKILDKQKQIILCAITSKEIMKGEILSLNRNLLINPDLIQ